MQERSAAFYHGKVKGRHFTGALLPGVYYVQEKRVAVLRERAGNKIVAVPALLLGDPDDQRIFRADLLTVSGDFGHHIQDFFDKCF